jgi:hypothetical protein
MNGRKEGRKGVMEWTDGRRNTGGAHLYTFRYICENFRRPCNMEGD